jgi:hypothetical protein
MTQVGAKRIAWLAAVAVLALGLWIFRANQPHEPLPPANASVTQVATAYLDAAVRQDCGFTRALTTQRTFSWCSSPSMTAYRDLTGPVAVSAEGGGVAQQCMSFGMTTTGSGDGSIPEGDVQWGLCFVSTDAGWRVHDQGKP